MKQTSLFKQFFLLVLLLVGSATGAWADEVTITLSQQGYSNAEVVTSTTSGDVTLTYNKGESSTDPAYYNTGTGVRVYAGGNMTITANSNTITKVIVTFAKNNSPTISLDSNGTNTSTGTESPAEWVGSATEVYFNVTNKGHARIQSVAVTYSTGGGSSVTAPTFSVASSAVTAGTTVSLTQATADEIRYTTDGTAPTTTTGTVYSTPIAITEPVTIKAIAVEGGVASSVATATYTISVTTPTITGGTNVTITGDDGCTFYYTTATGNVDPANPDNNSTEYTAPFTPADGTKIKAIAYDAYGNKSDVTSVFTFMYMPLNPKNINSNYYVKVTDASTLENGDAILIVNETAEQALGAQSGNNCPDETVDISDGVISDKGEALKLILVKKTEKVNDVDTEVFYFYTGAGYLYAASSSKNYLKEQNPATTNARATISISSGDAAITFKGSNTHNIVRYNSGDGLFSCYASGQSPVQIYKEVASVDVTDAKYATYVTACDVDFAASTGVTAYKVTGANGKIELEEVDAAPKGTPLVIAANEDTYVLTIAASAPAAVTGNLLKAADGNQTGDGNTCSR